MFAANPSGRWQIFNWDRESAQPVSVTALNVDARAPALNLGSTRVAFTTSDGGIWILDLGSKGAQKIGARFSNGSYGSPFWIGPDLLGYTLYTVTPPTEDSDIYAHSIVEGKQKAVVRQTGSQDYASASPNGDRLAYMSSVTTTVVGLGNVITQQLWVADLRTGKAEQITVGGSRDTRPNWSPDGMSIVFSSDRDGNPEIWVIDLATRKTTKVTNGKGEKTAPCWSPDGKQILYVTTVTGRRTLEIIDLATGQTKPLRPFGNKDVEICDPVWVR